MCSKFLKALQSADAFISDAATKILSSVLTTELPFRELSYEGYTGSFKIALFHAFVEGVSSLGWILFESSISFIMIFHTFMP